MFISLTCFTVVTSVARITRTRVITRRADAVTIAVTIRHPNIGCKNTLFHEMHTPHLTVMQHIKK